MWCRDMWTLGVKFRCVVLVGAVLALSGGPCEAEDILVPLGSDALLPCSTSVSRRAVAHAAAIHWRKNSNGRVRTVCRRERSGLEFRHVSLAGRTQCPQSDFRSGDYSLRICATRAEDGGEYICTVQEGQRKTVKTVFLRVIQVLFSLPTPIEGSRMQMTCSVNPKPQGATVSWKLNGDPQPRYSSTVTFDYLKQTHSGNWTCVVGYKQAKGEATESMEVKGITIPQNDGLMVYGAPGSSVTLPCVFSEGLRSPAVAWEKVSTATKASLPLPLSFNKNTSVFSSGALSPASSLGPWDLSARVESVEVKDEGTYRCSGELQGNKGLRTRVKRDIQLVVAQVFSTLSRNGSRTLTCHLSNASEVTAYEWLRVTYDVNGTQTVTPAGKSKVMTIPKVTETDIGEWVCCFSGKQGILGNATYHLHMISGQEGVERETGKVNRVAMVLGLGFLFLVLLLFVLQVYRNRRRRKMTMPYPAMESIVHSNFNERERRQIEKQKTKSKGVVDV
ncbi:lymphocyte activation gene 3 protein [Chanos chanos]|uniref:Lymphocyte activation gene 3 protein n=1 Tax=Chanos chanos TaxID=29144 RepID=A0A6J2WAP7_CHACN|nr:lymphocyte activation gene 3 protein-like [Chanos chanos]